MLTIRSPVTDIVLQLQYVLQIAKFLEMPTNRCFSYQPGQIA